MEKSGKSKIFELLYKNNENEIENFIISNGKVKKVSPIYFFPDGEIETIESTNEIEREI